jgi:hypothetical protein
MTDISLIQEGQCTLIHHITDFIVMSCEERTIYENNHIFDGYMKLDSSFNYLDLYNINFWTKKNLSDSGNYRVVSKCHAILAQCTN